MLLQCKVSMRSRAVARSKAGEMASSAQTATAARRTRRGARPSRLLITLLVISTCGSYAQGTSCRLVEGCRHVLSCTASHTFLGQAALANAVTVPALFI